MSNWVKFMCYADGNIIMSEDGVEYDRAPKTLIKVDLGTQYMSLKENLAEELEIDLSLYKLEINHRYPMTECERTKYVLIPIKNDKDVFLLIDFAIEVGKMQCQSLFIGKNPIVEQGSSPSVNSPSIPIYRPLRVIVDNAQGIFTGPLDASVLSRQDKHRSQLVWDSEIESNATLTCRRAEASFRRREAELPIDPRMTQLLDSAGFLGVSKLPFIQLDWHLITALVERWRPETHSFHLPVGEVTITLQDIGIQFGLPIDGPPVVGNVSHIWRDVCEQYLGLTPPTVCLDGGRLKMSWLVENFSNREEMEDDQIARYTRAYILQLIGGILFGDKSQNRVHLMFLPLLEDLQPEQPYSWGSAVLAWLYRQLCQATDKDVNEISGPLLLVQLWAWDRLPFIAPIRRQLIPIEDAPLGARWGVSKDVTQASTHAVMQYRMFFDRQTPDQIVWQPYSEQILTELPHYCIRDAAIWPARVPLICFHIVEWHLPERVVRQFGGTQQIPPDCDTEIDLHKIDLRNKTDAGWQQRHNRYIHIWSSRHDKVLQVITGARDVHPNYMTWYLPRTRRWISKTGAIHCYLVEQMQLIRDHASNEDDASIKYIEKLARKALKNAGVHEIVHSADDYVHDHETAIMETHRDDYREEQSTPGALQRRRSNRKHRRTHGEGTSTNPLEFGSQSFVEDNSKITKIDRALMLLPSDDDDMPRVTRQYHRSRRNR